MKTLTEKYKAILEGSFSREQFLRDVRLSHPNLVNQFNTFDDAVAILKNKGMLYETEHTSTVYSFEETNRRDRFPIEAIERGVDAELEDMGLDSALAPSEEEYDRAMNKALNNLEKDFNHYLNKLTGEKPKSKRVDILQPASPANTVDKDNGIKKFIMKESIKDIIISILSKQDKKSLNEELDPNRESDIQVRNALNSVLATLEQTVDLQNIADPEYFKDTFMTYLREELDNRMQGEENLLAPDITEGRKFNYQGQIV